MNALEASQTTRGAEDVTVAVIDEVDFSPPDLRGRQWVNPGEFGSGRENNGADDDGNGLVDDANGYDFANGDNTVHDEFDDFHSTHVAGTIATSENGEGIVGVAPNARVMALKFIGPTGGTTSAAIEAIRPTPRPRVPTSSTPPGAASATSTASSISSNFVSPRRTSA